MFSTDSFRVSLITSLSLTHRYLLGQPRVSFKTESLVNQIIEFFRRELNLHSGYTLHCVVCIYSGIQDVVTESVIATQTKIRETANYQQTLHAVNIIT